MPDVKLQKGKAEAPDVARVPVVGSAIGVRVEPLGAHVRARADERVARVERAAHDLADAEIGDLDLHLPIHEEIRRLDVAVDDLVAVEVAEAFEHLPRDPGEEVLGERAGLAPEEAIERAAVHVLHDEADVAAGLLEDAVAADDVRRVGAAEDVHLAEDLAADGGVAVGLDDFEGVEGAGAAVADLVDGAAVAVAEDLKLLQIGEAVDVGRSGGGEGRRREREGEARAAVGCGVRQRELEVQVSSFSDDCHVFDGFSPREKEREEFFFFLFDSS